MHDLLAKAPVTFTKTVSESDVYLFAGITGDFSPNHVDDAAMRRTSYGQRIAHGALMIGYMSTASTRAIEQGLALASQANPVSLGYDRVRFLKAVFFGDTITVKYTLKLVDEERMRSEASVEVRNQKDELVAVATHIMKWVPNTAPM
ncbi:MAG TPA: MaoC/PaaZ C-terminal domain-containing protein [Roseiarcus sp.]|nr:MaoC/PaaZ C-terminal domain-containing protein [Roseiarcus sp.]